MIVLNFDLDLDSDADTQIEERLKFESFDETIRKCIKCVHQRTICKLTANKEHTKSNQTENQINGVQLQMYRLSFVVRVWVCVCVFAGVCAHGFSG